MSQKELNLGILAHVDAGKTTLTERLLYEAGVIRDVGSVDAGTTQTDTLALERQRGITIKSAVASFAIGDVHVNLIDTPGHPDFIAEVERVLSVLDGAVLVVSAVEGVQPQTRILMRALRRLRVPTLLFVNKLDRTGADAERVLRQVRERLTPAIVLLVDDEAQIAEALAERDDELLAEYVSGDLVNGRIREALVAQTRNALVHPVLFGAAITGEGVGELQAAIAELLPSSSGDVNGPLAARVFKIERGNGGDKIAYARLFAGTLHVRDRVRFGRDGDGKVTALAVFDSGPASQQASASAGSIAKVWGLHDVRIGDALGDATAVGGAHEFPPPTLESVVEAVDPGDGARLRTALAQLDEQDPLINVRLEEGSSELSVSLYGEVQKEVIESTLADDYGIAVAFREVTPICIERPLATGEAVQFMHTESNPHEATIGLRIEPALDGAGFEFHLQIDPRVAPLYLYKTLDNFELHMREYVHDALAEGLLGWQVTDCVVTLVECMYAIPDGPPARRGRSTIADFRKLTPLVVTQTLANAGTRVCEPIVRATLELPADTLGAVMPALSRLGAAIETSTPRGVLALVEALVPASSANDLQRQLPGLTHGEGVLESTFAGYRPVVGEAPKRRGRR